MHQESHKIFEAYVLAKRLEDKQLNEGIMDFLGGLKVRREDKMRYNTYKDMWTRFWYPRFAKKGDIKTNKEKAIDTFDKFLNSRRWADENMEVNKDQALEYVSKNHGSMDFDNLQKGAIETLLYGQTSTSTPAKTKEPAKKTAPETKTAEPAADAGKVVDQAASSPTVAPTMSKSERDNLSPDDRAEIDKKTFARPETVAPTPAPVTSPAETPAEPEEDAYKLKAEVTRLKNLNQAWIGAIKKKFGRNVRKPSDLVGKKSVVRKK